MVWRMACTIRHLSILESSGGQVLWKRQRIVWTTTGKKYQFAVPILEVRRTPRPSTPSFRLVDHDSNWRRWCGLNMKPSRAECCEQHSKLAASISSLCGSAEPNYVCALKFENQFQSHCVLNGPDPLQTCSAGVLEGFPVYISTASDQSKVGCRFRSASPAGALLTRLPIPLFRLSAALLLSQDCLALFEINPVVVDRYEYLSFRRRNDEELKFLWDLHEHRISKFLYRSR